MLMPSVFGETLFDDWFDFPFGRDFWTDRSANDKNQLYRKQGKSIMSTDVRETENGYEVDIDLPGFKKEDLTLQLEKGCLTVSAARNVNNDEKDKDGRYIRRERYAGSMSRSFYVGEELTEEDIRARFEDGILKLSLPKAEQKAVEAKKYIAIEG